MAELPEPETPDYSGNENAEPGFVRIKLQIPNLKVKSGGLLGKIMDKKTQGKNATIQDPVFEERLCDIQVDGDGMKEMKGKRYRFRIERLPYAIIPRHSYIKAEDGFVIVFLKKSDEDQSWQTHIENDTLETSDRN